MTSRAVYKVMLGFYLVIFFGYLFGPLVVMGLTSINTPSYPQAYPIEDLTFRWFAKLFGDEELMEGITNSLIIGVGVVALSVPAGLAGAIVMTQVYAKARGLYYLIVVSPVLTPGVILGISTVIFWRQFTDATGLKMFYNGYWLSILGQSTFISAYSMLIFLSRLQRFDRSQEEAALDLGATYPQVFRQILLPFLKPAIFSAGVLAFLSSFENYNTTTFAILAEKTLTTVLAGRVRQGTTPAISALAMLIVLITLAGAVAYEVLRRREQRKEARAMALAAEAERRGADAIAASPSAA